MTIEKPLKQFQEFYLAKNFQKARELLETHSSDIDPIIWHYNMGSTLAELDQTALARYHFLKAEQLGFTSEKLLQSKLVVEKKLEVDKWEKSLTTSDFIIKGSRSLAEGPLVTLALIVSCFFILSYKKLQNKRQVAYYFSAISFIVLLNFGIKFIPFKITTEVGQLFEGPSNIFISRSEIPAGVMIMTWEDSEWEKVLYPSRFQGWIKKSNSLKSLGD